MQRFSLGRYLMHNIAVDLGTANTVIAVKNRGIVLREPSAVAVSASGGEMVAVGAEALAMLGRAPGGINILYPMKDGVVADVELAQAMLGKYLEKALGRRASPLGIRLAICLPLCVTGVERKALVEAAHGVGAREVAIMGEPMAAALGAGLPVCRARGSMVVDIGGGTTDAAVLALSGVAASRSVRVGGTHIDAAIAAYVQREYEVMIGERTAEDIKKRLGCALLGGQESIQVRGRSCKKGLPVSLVLDAAEVNRAMMEPLRGIVAAVKETLAETPPELAGDVLESGITLTGGGALLNGMDKLLSGATGVHVRVAEKPMDCVATGALSAMQDGEEEGVLPLMQAEA